MADSTFDIVSKVDKQEANNALMQAQKEIESRYDFKGIGAEIDWSGEKILMKAMAAKKVGAIDNEDFLEFLDLPMTATSCHVRSIAATACM